MNRWSWKTIDKKIVIYQFVQAQCRIKLTTIKQDRIIVVKACSAYIKRNLQYRDRQTQMGRWIVAICSVFLKLLLTAKKQVNREWAWSISTIWLRAASIISSLFHSLHYLKFHNGEASPFSLQRLNERWRWMEAQNAANRNERARTSPQTAVGETYTGSSTQFSSSVFSHAPHPFDVRENPFQKRQQGYVFTELRLVCVCV